MGGWVVGGWVVGGWVLDFTRLMLISTQVEVVVEVGVELGNKNLTELLSLCIYSQCRGNCRNWRFCSLLLLLFKVLDLLLKGSKISFLFEFNICLLAATLLVMCVPWSRIADNWVLLTR